MKVLFIGATGLVGSHVIPFLKDKFDLSLSAINSGTIEGIDVAAVDICDWDAIERFLKKGSPDGGKFDAVVYCATANYRENDHFDPEGLRLYYENCIEVNVRGAYHVFEAARRAGIPKVVHIGSATSMLGSPRVESINAEIVNRANDLYAASKIFGEQVGRSYAFHPLGSKKRHMNEMRTMQVLCLRLGHPFLSQEQWFHNPHKGTRLPVYVGDIARAIACALHSEIRYGVYPIVSAVPDPWILPEAYAELGYTPGWKFTDDRLIENTEPSAI
ncbi:MAG: NAD-dependent epimerase/dehydratase family protein [Abditibacteriaceae bacterium]